MRITLVIVILSVISNCNPLREIGKDPEDRQMSFEEFYVLQSQNDPCFYRNLKCDSVLLYHNEVYTLTGRTILCCVDSNRIISMGAQVRKLNPKGDTTVSYAVNGNTFYEEPIDYFLSKCTDGRNLLMIERKDFVAK